MREAYKLGFVTVNESALVSMIALLQYRVAKLEGLTEEDARKVAVKVLMTQGAILADNVDSLDDPEAFAAYLESSKLVLERMIYSNRMQYQDLDKLK